MPAWLDYKTKDIKSTRSRSSAVVHLRMRIDSAHSAYGLEEVLREEMMESLPVKLQTVGIHEFDIELLEYESINRPEFNITFHARNARDLNILVEAFRQYYLDELLMILKERDASMFMFEMRKTALRLGLQEAVEHSDETKNHNTRTHTKNVREHA